VDAYVLFFLPLLFLLLLLPLLLPTLPLPSKNLILTPGPASTSSHTKKDNCFTSSILDVSNRLDAYEGYRSVLGRERDLSFWAVPQGFGREAYWVEVPRGEGE